LPERKAFDDVSVRQVTYAEGAKVAATWGVPFVESSAQTGINTEQLFYGIARMVHQVKLRSLREIEATIRTNRLQHATNAQATLASSPSPSTSPAKSAKQPQQPQPQPQQQQQQRSPATQSRSAFVKHSAGSSSNY
jgi:hypothetical protein